MGFAFLGHPEVPDKRVLSKVRGPVAVHDVDQLMRDGNGYGCGGSDPVLVEDNRVCSEGIDGVRWFEAPPHRHLIDLRDANRVCLEVGRGGRVSYDGWINQCHAGWVGTRRLNRGKWALEDVGCVEANQKKQCGKRGRYASEVFGFLVFHER